MVLARWVPYTFPRVKALLGHWKLSRDFRTVCCDTAREALSVVLRGHGCPEAGRNFQEPLLQAELASRVRSLFLEGVDPSRARSSVMVDEFCLFLKWKLLHISGDCHCHVNTKLARNAHAQNFRFLFCCYFCLPFYSGFRARFESTELDMGKNVDLTMVLFPEKCKHCWGDCVCVREREMMLQREKEGGTDLQHSMGPKVLINILENSFCRCLKYLFASWSVTKRSFLGISAGSKKS